MEPIIQNSKNSKRKFLLIGGSVVLLLAIFSFSYLATLFSDNTPPTLDGGDQELQGLIMSGKFLKFDDDDFDRAEEMDEDSTARQKGVQYFYSAVDVKKDTITDSKNNGFEPVKSMTIEDIAFSIKAKKDLQCVIIKWDPEEKKFVTFPKGNYKNTIVPDEDELDEYWTNSYEGFNIICSKSFDTWFVAGADEMINNDFEDDFDHYNLNNFVAGWHLYAFPTSKSLKNTLNACPERISKVYVQTDSNNFKKIDVKDEDEFELSDDWHMVWFKVKGDEDTCTEESKPQEDPTVCASDGLLKSSDLYICKDKKWVMCDSSKQASQVQISGRTCLNGKWIVPQAPTNVCANYQPATFVIDQSKSKAEVSGTDLTLTLTLTTAPDYRVKQGSLPLINGATERYTASTFTYDFLDASLRNLQNGVFKVRFSNFRNIDKSYEILIPKTYLGDSYAGCPMATDLRYSFTTGTGTQPQPTPQCSSGIVDLQNVKICVNNVWVNDTCSDKAGYKRYIAQDFTIWKEISALVYTQTLPSTKKTWADSSRLVQQCTSGSWVAFTETSGSGGEPQPATPTACTSSQDIKITSFAKISGTTDKYKITFDKPFYSISNSISAGSIIGKLSYANSVNVNNFYYDSSSSKSEITIKYSGSPGSNVIVTLNPGLFLIGTASSQCTSTTPAWTNPAPAAPATTTCTANSEIKITSFAKISDTSYRFFFDKPFESLNKTITSSTVVGSANGSNFTYSGTPSTKDHITVTYSGAINTGAAIKIVPGFFKVGTGTSQCISAEIVWTATAPTSSTSTCSANSDINITSFAKISDTSYRFFFDKPFESLNKTITSSTVVGSANGSNFTYSGTPSTKDHITVTYSGAINTGAAIKIVPGFFKVGTGTSQCISAEIVWTATAPTSSTSTCSANSDINITSFAKISDTSYRFFFDKPYESLNKTITSSTVVGSANGSNFTYYGTPSTKDHITVTYSGAINTGAAIKIVPGFFKVGTGTSQCISGEIVWTATPTASPTTTTSCNNNTVTSDGKKYCNNNQYLECNTSNAYKEFGDYTCSQFFIDSLETDKITAKWIWVYKEFDKITDKYSSQFYGNYFLTSYLNTSFKNTEKLICIYPNKLDSKGKVVPIIQPDISFKEQYDNDGDCYFFYCDIDFVGLKDPSEQYLCSSTKTIVDLWSK